MSRLIIVSVLAGVLLIAAIVYVPSVSAQTNQVTGRYDWHVVSNDIYVFDVQTAKLWIISSQGGKWVRKHVTDKNLIEK